MNVFNNLSLQDIDSVFQFITYYFHSRGKRLGTEGKETRITETMATNETFSSQKNKIKIIGWIIRFRDIYF